MNFGCFYYYYYLKKIFFNHFINVFAKNYVVINCLNELIRFIVYNVTTYITANSKFLTNSTKVTKVFPTRWCTGPPWDPKNHFAIVIWDEYYTLYIYTLTIFKKQIPHPPQKKYRFKMEANDLFCLASFQFRQKYEKPLFQRSFLMEFESWF